MEDKLFARSHARSAARVCEGLARFGNELPVITSRMQRQLEHAVGIAISDLRVGQHSSKCVMARASCAYHKLADAVHRIEVTVGVLWRKALVIVLVTGKHNVGAKIIERLPDRLHLHRAAVGNS